MALVTGGGRGLGRATALALAGAGAAVAVADLVEERAARAEQEIKDLRGHGLGVACDASDEASVEALVERVNRNFGHIDILINTVAWLDPAGLLVDTSLDTWEKTLKYDLTSHFLCCKHVLKTSMIPRNYGRIVNISSEAGKEGFRLRGAYCAAKSGVISLSSTLAVETAEYDITVNALCPRSIAGPRLDAVMKMFTDYASAHGEAPAASARPRTHQRPAMTPEELAELIVFVVGPDGSRINGQALSVA